MSSRGAIRLLFPTVCCVVSFNSETWQDPVTFRDNLWTVSRSIDKSPEMRCFSVIALLTTFSSLRTERSSTIVARPVPTLTATTPPPKNDKS